MDRSGVLVVGETPSLGRSIADLLESWDVPVEYAIDLTGQQPLAEVARRFQVLVVASNSVYSPTARRWIRGELGKVELIVVGSRDPEVAAGPHLLVVPLPLLPTEFLAKVRRLLEPGRSSAAEPSGPAPRGHWTV